MTWPLALGLAVAVLQDPSSVATARNLGVAHYERGDYGLAAASFEKVLEDEIATARDAFNAGMAALQNQDVERALAHFTTARQMDPSLLEAEFGLAVLYKRQQLNPRALEAFERVVARDSEDPCTWLNIGILRQAMGRAEDAERAFDRVVAMGPARGANFYVSALFRKANLVARRGATEEARRLFEAFETARAESPSEALTPTALENGAYGRVRSPTLGGQAAAEPPRSVGLDELEPLDAPRCESGDPPAPVLGDYDRDGLVDVFVASTCGGSLLYRNEGQGRLRDVTREVGLEGLGEIAGAVFLDDEVSDLLSIYVWSARARIFRGREGRYLDESASAELPTDAGAALPLDFDNDGQLDLFGLDASVLRNDGDGTFSRTVHGEAVEAREAVAGDFDEDGFVDVLLALETGDVLLAGNQGGRALRRFSIRFRGRRLAVIDLDRDGWLDVVGWEDGGLVWLRNADGRGLRPAGPPPDGPGDRWLVRLGGTLMLNRTLIESPFAVGTLPPAVAADLEGEGETTLVSTATSGRIRRFRESRPAPGWLRIALVGKRSNRAGIGAHVEVKAGRFYRKQEYRGLPLTFDTRGRERVDVVRVTWANGVVQNAIDVPTEASLVIEEDDRQTSSCPFLYVWDGARFRFLTDVVGRAPLGEITPEDGWVTPNPDDYLRIPPGAMKARDGRYVLQLTEELRELALVDGVALLAIDSPADVEIFTDERFHAPPFESFRLHAVSAPRAPASAANAQGDDVLDVVTSADGRYVAVRPHPVPGFAFEHALVLERPRAGAQEDLVLLLSGFVEWPSSSSMRALSANESFAPRPPALEVENDRGGWTSLVEELGLPSGIDRTLVVELEGAPRRLRVVTNFAVHWDRAAFASPVDPRASRTRELPLVAADLHYRGFSSVTRVENEPERYDYERLLPAPPWDGASGRYTRFGDVRELVRGIDETLVVMAPGDEMTLVFDGAGLPDLPDDHERTFVLHVRGWAKDQDPNTRFSRTVEPFPVGGDDPSRSRVPPRLVPELAPR